jgi:hypothetical protein
VRHWLLEARAERDPWKKFLWSFLALEILARKAGKALYPEMLGRLNMAAVPEAGASGIIELIPPHDRQTLVGCFATMSLVLSPTTAGDDIASFKKVKQFRDAMAHGSLRAQADLPVTETDSLLQRYFQLAAARLLAPEA